MTKSYNIPDKASLPACTQTVGVTAALDLHSCFLLRRAVFIASRDCHPNTISLCVSCCRRRSLSVPARLARGGGAHRVLASPLCRDTLCVHQATDKQPRLKCQADVQKVLLGSDAGARACQSGRDQRFSEAERRLDFLANFTYLLSHHASLA